MQVIPSGLEERVTGKKTLGVQSDWTRSAAERGAQAEQEEQIREEVAAQIEALRTQREQGAISQEQFTVEVDRIKRSVLRVEILSATDSSKARLAGADEGGDGGAASPAGEDGYRPSVSTWGVFPRPKSISKAYGGGKNIAPGSKLESKEEEEAAKKRTAEALLRYK